MNMKKKALAVAIAGVLSTAAHATSNFDAQGARDCYNNPDTALVDNLSNCGQADLAKIGASENPGEAVGNTLDFGHSIAYATIGDRYLDTPSAGGVPAATATTEDALVAALTDSEFPPEDVPGQAEVTALLDSNGDGEITPEDFEGGEVPGQAEVTALLDSNGDGEITPEDFEGGEIPGQAEITALLDSNGDGEITPEDFEGGDVPGQEDVIALFDANGDGEITPEDFEGGEVPGQAEITALLDSNGDGEITPEDFEGGEVPGQAEVIALFDSNGDGEITPEDFEGGDVPGQEDIIALLDSNGDGEVTPEDFELGDDPTVGLVHQLVTAANTVITPLGVSVKDQDGSSEYTLDDILFNTMAAEPAGIAPALVSDVAVLFDTDQLATVIDLVEATANGDPEVLLDTLSDLGSGTPGTETGDEYTHRLPVRISGSVTGANETCSVSATGGKVTFDFGAISYKAFTGRSKTASFNVQCGPDRAEAANMYLSMNEQDPELGGGTADMNAVVSPNGADPVQTSVKVFYDELNNGNGVEIGQSEAATTIGSTSKTIRLFAEVADREIFTKGATIAAENSAQQLYVWLK